MNYCEECGMREHRGKCEPSYDFDDFDDYGDDRAEWAGMEPERYLARN